jgi:HEAT repeat protein
VPKPAFERRLEALHALRSAPDSPATSARLREALNDRNNYLVGRAAELVAELKLDELIPELLAAFDRFFVDPVASDPHCLAKNAIANALRDLGHHGAPAFLRGIAHVQLEPTWGGRADTAAPLRATCALALADCILDDLEILTHLTDALADPDKLVRMNAAIAVEQLGRPEGALLLRLKLLTGDAEPDVLGQCCASLLSLAPQGALSFISRFLKSPDESVQFEAASALAQARDPEAIAILKEFWLESHLPLDLRQALLINLGASPIPESAEFLLSLVEHEPINVAASAITALANSRFRSDVYPRLSASVAGRDSSQLKSLFEQQFGHPQSAEPGQR